jgi:outer membrane protein assembly factor BamB
LYALKATTGEKKWNYTTYGDVDSSPAIAYSMVFVGSTGGNLYAFNATTSTAQLIWNKTMSIGWSSPAIAEEKVFIGSKDWKVYALSIAENGSEVWSYKTNGPVESSPAILNDTLYVGSQDGYLYAFHSEVHDVAVLSVIPKPPTVYQNETVSIDVTLMNEGTFNETDINVTVYYDSNFLNSSFINIPRQKPGTTSFSWNTSGITPANYTISANATLTLTSDEDPLDNNFTDGIVWVKAREVHDVAVTNVTTCKDGCLPMPVIGQNYTAHVYVTVLNEGDFQETFNVTVYANFTEIGKQEVELNTGDNTNITFTWNTTGFAYGNYTISAVADTVPGETDTEDNTLIDGWVYVTIPGDLNGDGYVKIGDIVSVISNFPKTPSSPNWNPNADWNDDHKGGIGDIVITIGHFGESAPP